jgi:hypothetical protein
MLAFFWANDRQVDLLSRVGNGRASRVYESRAVASKPRPGQASPAAIEAWIRDKYEHRRYFDAAAAAAIAEAGPGPEEQRGEVPRLKGSAKVQLSAREKAEARAEGRRTGGGGGGGGRVRRPQGGAVMSREAPPAQPQPQPEPGECGDLFGAEWNPFGGGAAAPQPEQQQQPRAAPPTDLFGELMSAGVVPPPSHNCPDRTSGMAEVYLRF